MQVAIVSTDMINVDEHFGRAERFLIYKIDGASPMFLDIRVVAAFSDGDKSHEFNSYKFEAISSKLTDCDRLYCNRIGARPAAELKKLGIEPVIYVGPIAKITL